ncbi:MAG: thymidine phosphorylase [Acidobacteriota bacterium]|nr:thymidine phosphorylase [Acidobacteriota bacterium]
MSKPIHVLDILQQKRDGLALSGEQMESFIRGVTQRDLPGAPTDAQIAAFLMAVFLRGLTPQELASLTNAMRFSGETFDASPLRTFAVDKHSTGGVGDKTSLLLAPILAAAGLAECTPEGVPGLCVPMISGRSLGHTGGTLDKLETIPGFNTQLSLAEFTATLRRCGAALIGQTPTLVPADRILYAMRDHIGTIESPNLITASIMSKKLAESLNGLVLDVKTGSGAFMRTDQEARHLAELMVQTGTLAGTRTVAVLTTMHQPLGRFAGNWVEVWECVDLMQHHEHPLSADLLHLTHTLAGWMLHLAGKAEDAQAGYLRSQQILRSGAAYQAWLRIVAAQGGDTSVFTTPASFHRPAASRVIAADAAGYLASMDCTQVGWAVQRLGAGRARPGDPVSAHAGIECHAKLGQVVQRGQPLFTLFSEDARLLDEPADMLRQTLQITEAAPDLPPLIREVVQYASPAAAPLDR